MCYKLHKARALSYVLICYILVCYVLSVAFIVSFLFALQVARWFFRVGGAAGTIAKSVSAYDMTISDSMYGAAKRCVPDKRIDSSVYILHITGHQNPVVDPIMKHFKQKLQFMSLVANSCLLPKAESQG